MSDLEKMIKVNSLLILIANYNADKSLEANRFFRESACSLLSSLGLVFSGESNFNLTEEVYRLQIEVSNILSKDSCYELFSEIPWPAHLGVFMGSIENFVEQILSVEQFVKMQMDYLKTKD